ncbi:hypothetical protein GCM10023191_097930 [Actinoallomurus oryzae]|uniref:Uncharacterized protein n=1 Tax=Actinoallomurus oryzae TaxID=502180 RepID=A0ABP8R879_9ACTN
MFAVQTTTIRNSCVMPGILELSTDGSADPGRPWSAAAQAVEPSGRSRPGSGASA